MTEQPRDDPVVFRFFNEIGIIEQLARNSFERVVRRGPSNERTTREEATARWTGGQVVPEWLGATASVRGST